MNLAYAFLNFDQLINEKGLVDSKIFSQDIIRESVLKKDDLIKKLINYIENQINDTNAKNNVINLLFIFSIMIQKSKNMIEIQNLFNNNGAVNMVLTILSSPNKPDF